MQQLAKARLYFMGRGFYNVVKKFYSAVQIPIAGHTAI